ncbi:MAG: beta-propeller domain-containing protein [Candidatus Bathyarchaeia archaeon]
MRHLSGRDGFRFPTDGRRILVRSSAFFMLGAILGLTLLNIVGLPIVFDNVQTKTELIQFSSYEELRDFLNRSTSVRMIYGAETSATTFGASKDAQLSVSPDYSRTNIQVEGVDEADIVKTDGEYIYYASDKGLIISRAYPPESAKVLAQISFNGTIRGLLINKDRLVVFEEDYLVWLLRAESMAPSGGASASIVGRSMIPAYRGDETHVWVYNVEDKLKPVLEHQVSLNGSYFTSRMVGDDVYVLVSQPAYLIAGEVPLPVVKYDGREETVDASKIYYSNDTDYYYSFTTVLAFNIMRDEAPKYETVLVGSTSAVYVSRENVYVAIPKVQVVYEGSSASDGQTQERTEIHRIGIKNGRIKLEASGAVPGRVLNQFSMDEYNGHFRIATTLGRLSRSFEESTSVNNVYVLSLNLTIVGRLEGLAPGESIYSARFMGGRGYLVTFKKVDPLFVLDLKQPADPKVLGKLKITGYSDYLHPYDENHIIGVGKETVAAEEGDFAWYQGVKISLFDVSNVSSPIEIDKYEIGDRGTDSPLLRDHKALLFDKKRGILVMPVLVARIDPADYPKGVPPYAYGEYIWQGAYVFSVSDKDLTLRGRVSHIGDLDQVGKGHYDLPYRYFVERALYIGDVLYTVSDGKILMNNLEDLKQINELELP